MSLIVLLLWHECFLLTKLVDLVQKKKRREFGAKKKIMTKSSNDISARVLTFSTEMTQFNSPFGFFTM